MSHEARRDIRLHRSNVKAVLPEHFARDYPKLVSFLEAYYEFMREDDTHGFDETIHDLIKNRDVLSGDLLQLEKAMSDMTLGLDFSTVLSDARIKSQLFANWYRNKGNLYSIEQFFNWLYGESAVVEYGKNSVFIVSESKIGPASQKYIKNDKLYQTFAFLIKVGIPVSKWRDAYKTFAHPAGFYFQGEVVVESSIDLGYRLMPEVVLDDNAGTITVENSAAVVSFSALSSITGLYPDDADSDGDQQRVEFNTTVEGISGLTIEELHANYKDLEDVIDANSPTFDAIDDGYYKSVKFSSTVETMDQDTFDLVQIGSDFENVLADSDTSSVLFSGITWTFDNARLTMDHDNTL